MLAFPVAQRCPRKNRAAERVPFQQVQHLQYRLNFRSSVSAAEIQFGWVEDEWRFLFLLAPAHAHLWPAASSRGENGSWRCQDRHLRRDATNYQPRRIYRNPAP